jgi:hypothetical protein
MTFGTEPPLLKIATASAPAKTFSVTVRLTSLRAEEPPAAIFIALRTITRCASNPSNVPSATANQMPNIFPVPTRIKSSTRDGKNRPKLECVSYWGSLTALLVVFPFTLIAL